jgi:hypothetical protein
MRKKRGIECDKIRGFGPHNVGKGREQKKLER